MPQMNVFALSFPITISAGLFAMGLALPYTVSLFEHEFTTMIEHMLGLMNLLGHG
ncbi:MAG: flagellar biosynthetic protein FliR [Nitrospiraceae bacterium]